MKIRGNQRDLDKLMRIGERRHRRTCQHRWLQTVAAGRTVFDHEVGQSRTNEFEETIDSIDLTAQSFAEGTFAVVFATQTNRFIVINFEIPEPAAFQQIDHMFREIFYGLRIVEIPKPSLA